MTCYRKGGCGPYEMRSCNECPASKPEYAQRNQAQPKTHADRIRAMSDEELAVWIASVAEGGRGPVSEDICADCSEISCAPCWELWLKKEADNG